MSVLATAVLGASGFIGNRVVEVLHLDGSPVVAIAPRASSLALAGRFDLDLRIADAFDARALRCAFGGCETAIIAVAGDDRTITRTIAPVYEAAEGAGIRRLIYLSTASVHGQSPAPGTDETTPLSVRQPIPYNSAKIRAERNLLTCRRSGSCEVVILRPGIVYGPRSYWTGGLANELLAGEASLVAGGHGICNGIYVDNVVHAIRLAASAAGADRHAYLIGDDETITWRDLYRPVAEALGFDIDLLPTPPASAAPRRPSAAEWLRESRMAGIVPTPVRAGLMAAYRAHRAAGAPALLAPPGAAVTLEKALLHTCSSKLSFAKAERDLGYAPVMSFSEGCRRSVAWLAFAGYPVRGGEPE